MLTRANEGFAEKQGLPAVIPKGGGGGNPSFAGSWSPFHYFCMGPAHISMAGPEQKNALVSNANEGE